MLPLENMTVGSLLKRSAGLHRDCQALWYDGRYYTYQELEEQSAKYAAALVSLGIKKGDHVGLWAEIEPAVLFTFYAIQRIGAVAVLFNTNLVDDEMLPLLKATDIQILLAGKSYKTYRCLLDDHALPSKAVQKEMTLSVGESRSESLQSLTELAGNVTEEEIAAALEMEKAVSPEDTAVILFTSGSTSMPKGVMSSHYSRVNGGIQQAGDLLCSEKDRFCVTMPVFHCFCISVNIMAALAVGGCVCIPKDRHIRSILDTIEACGCTVMSSVPTMFFAMLARNKTEGRKLDTLRIGFIGGAYYPPEDFIRIDEAMGPQFTLMSSLGQTECTAGLTTCFVDDSMEVRSTTVGHFMNHVEGRIADIHTGETLPTGSLGEICVRGYLNMQGYYKRPDLTARTIDTDGWVHTEDLGVLDEQGNISLHGRLKELIIRGGENISPLEIETVLDQMEGISQVKVVGVPDPHYGEEICACVIPEKDTAPDEKDIRDFLTLHLAAFKIPKYILFFKDFPTTATGKIKAAQVQEMAIARLRLPAK